jgi:hypothetical protein
MKGSRVGITTASRLLPGLGKSVPRRGSGRRKRDKSVAEDPKAFHCPATISSCRRPR